MQNVILYVIIHTMSVPKFVFSPFADPSFEPNHLTSWCFGYRFISFLTQHSQTRRTPQSWSGRGKRSWLRGVDGSVVGPQQKWEPQSQWTIPGWRFKKLIIRSIHAEEIWKHWVFLLISSSTGLGREISILAGRVHPPTGILHNESQWISDATRMFGCVIVLQPGQPICWTAQKAN